MGDTRFNNINILFLFVCIIFLGFVSSFEGGDGTSGSPYQIGNCTQLQSMSDNLTASYILNNDINCSETSTWNSGAGFVPVGTGSSFTGDFDGKGYTISELYINRAGTSNQGLFSYINSAQVVNVTLLDVYVSGLHNAGGIAGSARNSGARIEDVHVSGTIIGGANQAGGLTGYIENYAYVYNSSFIGDVSQSTTSLQYNYGGLIGLVRKYGKVYNSYSMGTVYAPKSDRVGGFAGHNDEYSGPAYIYNSYSMSDATGRDYVGGFVGLNEYSYIGNSYSTGNARAIGSSDRGTSVGAFIGNRVSNGDWRKDVGSMYDMDSSRVMRNHGDAVLKTTTEMKTASTFNDWNTDSIWEIDTSKNYGYPSLRGIDYQTQIVRTEKVRERFSNYTIATLKGRLNVPDGSTTVFFQYREDGDSTWINSSNISISSEQEYEINVSGLTSRTVYEYRAVAQNSTTLSFGDTLEFISFFAGGDGSYTYPYQVSDVHELQEVENYRTHHFNQINDINASLTNGQSEWGSSGFVPIIAFTGLFNGMGYEISGLYINRPSNTNQGLFGYAKNSARIYNVHLVDSHVQGDRYIGGLMGQALYGTQIWNSSFSGDVVGSLERVGGLVGFMGYYSYVRNSYSSGTVSATGTTAYYVGGLVGYSYNHNYVLNSYSHSTVSGRDYVGGLIGRNQYGRVDSCYSTGNVQGVGYSDRGLYAGSFIAHNDITGTYWGFAVNSMYDMDSSRVMRNHGDAVLKTTTEMKTASTFNDWNTDSIWEIDTSKNYGYPSLRGIDYQTQIVRTEKVRERFSNYTIATLKGRLNVPEETTTVFFQYREDGDSTWINSSNISISSEQEYEINVSGLTSRTVYEYRAVAQNSTTLSFGDTLEFISFFAGGDGSYTYPYQVSDVHELQEVGNYRTHHFRQINDINASLTNGQSEWGSTGFVPIHTFSGLFDGRGYDISGLYINRPDNDYQGLFGYARNTARIRNVHLVDALVTGRYHVGALLAHSKWGAQIHNSSSNGTVTGTITYSNVGGLVGSMYYSSYVIDSHSHARVIGGSRAGGLVGLNQYARIYRSYATGVVTGTAEAYGFIGRTVTGGAYYCVDNYWDKETSGKTSGGGSASVGKTTAQMKTQSTFATFNFDTTWGIDNNSVINEGYPFNPMILLADDSSPEITMSSPVNNSFSDNLNVSLEIELEDDLALDNYTVSIWNQTMQLVETISSGVVGKISQVAEYFASAYDGIFTWRIRACDFVGNCGDSENKTFAVDTIYPIVNFSQTNPENNSGQTSSFVVNISINETNLKYITYSFNSETSSFIYDTTVDNTSILGLGVIENSWELVEIEDGSYYFTLTQGGLAPSGTYRYNITIEDAAGNSNITNTRIVRGNTESSLGSVSYTPADLDSLDPNETITFSASVHDAEENFNYSLIQWKNSTQTWEDAENITGNNIVMDNTTVKGEYTSTFGTFTPTYESNFSVRLVTVDEVEDRGYGEVYNLSVFWDCSWSVSPTTLGTKVGYNEQKNIENITLTNTGDAEFINGSSQCNLSLSLDHNLAIGRISFDSIVSKPSQGYELNPGESAIVDLSAVFQPQRLEENLIISVEEAGTLSRENYTNTTGTLFSYTGGPYLEVEATGIPTIIQLIPQEVSLTGIVRNLLGDSFSAYNVSFNWTTPEGFSFLGNITNAYSNISDLSDKESILNISLTAGNLVSLEPGSYELAILASGQNSSGDFITALDGENLFNQTYNLTFICPPGATAETVTADVCKPTVINSGSGESSSSGGGGGGGGNTVDAFSRSEGDVELQNGKETTFYFEIENKDNKTKTVEEIFIKGENADYITVVSGKGKKLLGASKLNITLEINAPAYFPSGKHLLQFDVVIKDAFGTSETVQKFMTLYILDVPRTDADSMLLEARKYLDWMEIRRLDISVIEEIFNSMNADYSSVSFTEVQSNFEELETIVLSAQEFIGLNSSLLDQINHAKDFDINVFETKKLWLLANVIFNRGDYVLAKQRINEAQSMYSYETKGEFGAVYYARKNPIQAFSALIVLFGIGLFGGFMSRKLYLSRKIKLLHREEKLLLELMQLVQGYTFKENKMSMGEYYEAMNQYESKLSRTIAERIKSEAALSSLTNLRSKKDALAIEKKRLIEMMRDLQDRYLNKGTIETKVYENMLKTYAKRLADVSEELVYMETKKMLRKGGL